jgi:serine/threonine protein kinase
MSVESKNSIDLIRGSDLNRQLAFTGMEDEPAVGACAICGRPLTQDGRCLRCLADLGFLRGSQEPGQSETPRRLTPGTLKYDHFEVEVGPDGFPIELGAGAMAITYRARDTVLNSIVALKVIDRKVAQTPGARSRFLREARAAAQIRHPNVARVSHYGEQDGECFYVMELVEGETLEAQVRREGPQPVFWALEIIEQVARALAAAEACGVVHRDIKPSNIMLECDPGGTPIVKVIDYGVAKVLAPDGQLGAEQTQTGFIGTPAFASPEQFVNLGQTPIDTRSDIYSLGVTFWYLLCGRVPFVGRTLEEVRVRQSEPLPIEQLKGLHFPTLILALLKSMLAQDPKDRPQSARELLAALHRCSERFNPEARTRRRRTLLIESLLVFAIVAIALGGWWYQHLQSSARMDRSIAVLPFENLSSDKENVFFTDGVQDEILTDLAKIADLKVISRTSVVQYKSGVERDLRKIARQLGVAHVVEGRVQRWGNRVRVNAQLIDVRNDAQLWAQTYDRDLDDVFAIQSGIARAIADQLQAKLSSAEKSAIEQRPTSDLTAFDKYSRAKTLIVTSGLGSGDKNLLPAIELLNSAVERDPSFHAAFCQLTWSHDQLYVAYGDHTPARLAAAEAALKRATELRPNASETHLAHGSHLFFAFRDYKGAREELDAARAGLPNDPRIPELTGYILRREGKHEEELRALEQAVAIDPRNPFTLMQLSFGYSYLRRYPEEKASLQRVLEITPDDVGAACYLAFVDLAWRADTVPLHRFIERIQTERPGVLADVADTWLDCALAERDWAAAEQALTALGNSPFWGDNGTIFSRQLGEGVLARAMHDEARARKAFTAARQEQEQMVQKQKDYGPPLCVLGLIDAALGNKEAALQERRRAIELLRSEKDTLTSQNLATYSALIAAWAGEKDLALQQLAEAAPTYGAALLTSYGMLKLSPFWDPLRGDPRFEAIVQRFAPTASQ